MTDSITKISTLAGVLALVSTAIVSQNDITVVSAEIEKVTGKDAPKGSRVKLILSGDGVGDATRRYFLRENSAFSTLIEDAGVFMFAPKKERGTDTYILYFGLNQDVVSYLPAPEPKAERVKMTPEQRKEARSAGKAAARLRRASEAAAAAEAGEQVAA